MKKIMDLNLQNKRLWLFFYSFFFLNISLLFSSFFIHGDQYLYRKFYDLLSNNSLVYVFESAKIVLGTSEPVYPLLASLFNFLNVSKDFFNSFFNFLFIFAILLMGIKQKVNIHILFFLLLTSSYFLQLYFEIERLKVALVFFLFSFVFFKKKYLFGLLVLLSIFTHVQVLMLYIALFFAYVFIPGIVSFTRNLKVSPIFLLMVIGLLFVCCILLFILWNHISSKVLYYGFYFRPLHFFKSLFLVLIFIPFLRKRHYFEYFYVMLPLVLFASFLSGDRINILIYFLIIFMLSRSSRLRLFGANLGYYLLFVIFGIKGVFSIYPSLVNGAWIYL